MVVVVHPKVRTMVMVGTVALVADEVVMVHEHGAVAVNEGPVLAALEVGILVVVDRPQDQQEEVALRLEQLSVSLVAI